MVMPIDGRAIDAHRNLAGDRKLEASRGDDDVGFEMLARFELNARRVETLDRIGYDRRLARLHRLEEIGVGDEAPPLFPRVVGRGEGLGVILVPEVRLKLVGQACLDLRVSLAPPSEPNSLQPDLF